MEDRLGCKIAVLLIVSRPVDVDNAARAAWVTSKVGEVGDQKRAR